MKNTLQECLDENKRLCEQEITVSMFRTFQEASNAALERDCRKCAALPQALRIIEAIQERAATNGPVYDGEVEEIAERIINEVHP